MKAAMSHDDVLIVSFDCNRLQSTAIEWQTRLPVLRLVIHHWRLCRLGIKWASP
ncbi:MAG: hypothetical protein IKR48_12425 [Kiritimatiellae bacterium]|nr:hypothetical protein [Kiritimatiellia bacterium]